MQENQTINTYNIDDAWENFLEDGNIKPIHEISKLDKEIPKASEIYVSTKTKIAYLSHPINLEEVFWKIQINPYHIPNEGVIKKQMKFNFINQSSVCNIQNKLVNLNNVDQYIISQIINPEGRIKFRDIRKISIGLCNKDITSYRSKKKSAFYNCFVIIIRMSLDPIFKEIHVKVFNTGKLEIPGIRCNKLLIRIMNFLVELLRPITNNYDLNYDINHCETVLINSNFNCGFYINRDNLFDILKYKYKINCIFDSCQYPGIQCKYNYIDDINNQEYKMSFMIFRTGSILIVGKCDEDILIKIYDFLKNILTIEYPNIYIQNMNKIKNISKVSKIKKRYIQVTNTITN